MLIVTNIRGYPQLTGSSSLEQGGPAITRITNDISIASNAALADLTGLSVTVIAGRTYQFQAVLFIKSGGSTGGFQTSVSGTATATDLRFDGWANDTGATGAVGYVQGSAKGTAVGRKTTTSDTSTIQIRGMITVNTTGTLTIQGAQDSSNVTATVFARGSYFIVFDATPPT